MKVNIQKDIKGEQDLLHRSHSLPVVTMQGSGTLLDLLWAKIRPNKNACLLIYFLYLYTGTSF